MSLPGLNRVLLGVNGEFSPGKIKAGRQQIDVLPLFGIS